MIEGLQILASEDPKGLDARNICAEHDQVWAGGDKPVSVESRAKLLELGWHFDREIECWSNFV